MVLPLTCFAGVVYLSKSLSLYVIYILFPMLACDSSCTDGSMRCHDFGAGNCCPFYDNSTCVEDCPAGLEPDDDFDCNCTGNFLNPPDCNGMCIVLANVSNTSFIDRNKSCVSCLCIDFLRMSKMLYTMCCMVFSVCQVKRIMLHAFLTSYNIPKCRIPLILLSAL